MQKMNVDASLRFIKHYEKEENKKHHTQKDKVS